MDDHETTGKALKYVEHAGGCQPGWKQKVDSLLDVILPCRCVACGLAAPSSGLCAGCHAGLPFSQDGCRTCGLPLPAGESADCGVCQRKPPDWDSVFAATWYAFPIRELVRRFKFRRNLAAGRSLAIVMSRCLNEAFQARPDLVVPVPLHRWRLAHRGFNQAFEIARPLARDFGLELSTYDLRRRRRTRRQAGLSARERKHNLDGAFAWHGPPLAGKRIALVDDVMTTGSTARECTRVLRRAGASFVDIWVLARAPRPGL
jgi:ComF family protein